jgi:hypothetical protein
MFNGKDKRAGVLCFRTLTAKGYFLGFLVEAPFPPFAVFEALAFGVPFARLEAAGLAVPGFCLPAGCSATGVWMAATEAL